MLKKNEEGWLGYQGGIANFDIPRRWHSWLKSEPEALLLQIFRLVRLGQNREEKCDAKQVTMVAKFRDNNNRVEIKKRRRRQ